MMVSNTFSNTEFHTSGFSARVSNVRNIIQSQRILLGISVRRDKLPNYHQSVIVADLVVDINGHVTRLQLLPLAAGYSFVCGLQWPSPTMVCWGDNQLQQVL